jgi:hypothetical protein
MSGLEVKVPFLARAKYFSSLLKTQNRCGTLQPLIQWVLGASFPGGKVAGV